MIEIFEKSAKFFYWLAGAAATFIPILLYIQYEKDNPPLWPFYVIVGVLLVSLILAIVSGLVRSYRSLELERDVFRLKPNQMDDLLNLSKKLLPETPSKKEVKKIYKTNNSVIQVQVSTKKFLGYTFSRICGFFTLLPITDEARGLLEEEKLSGLRMTPDHVLKERSEPEYVYLGSIASKGFRARHDLIQYVRGVVNQCFQQGVRAIYTRPTTQSGLRLAKRFDFEPVCDDVEDSALNRIYVLRNE